MMMNNKQKKYKLTLLKNSKSKWCFILFKGTFQKRRLIENILIFIQINYRFQTAIIYEQFKPFNGQKLLNTKITLRFILLIKFLIYY